MFFNEKRTTQREAAATQNNDTRSTGSSSARRADEGRERKRKRVQRACDMCRLKKSEGGQPSRKACIHCIVNKYDCTYLQMVENEVRDKAYVQALETRLARMEQLVRKVCPEIDIPKDLLSIQPNSSLEGPSAPGLHATPPKIQSLDKASVDVHDSESEDEQNDGREILAGYFEKVSLNSHFFGKSSGLSLIRTAMDYKDEDGSGNRPSRSRWTRLPPKQLEFWEPYSWSHRPYGQVHNFIYPDEDLMSSLVDNYFNGMNIYYPILHRPTFEESLADNLHHRDEGFGATLLIVCAVGARFSQDPRVFEGEDHTPHLAGTYWFNQIKRTELVMREEMPRLYDIQVAALSAQFGSGLLNPAPLTWSILGHGIRMAQSLGAHRRKVYDLMPPVQRELLKRAFWTLVQSDKDLCYFLGRPCAIQDEDFDVDLPVECDDEYWLTPDPAMAFKQPEGKPSYASYLSASIKLNRIQHHALRTIYSITKSKVESGNVGLEWEERTVMELDSALNLWSDSLPEQLKWNPKQPNLVFLTQAAALNVSFHNLQIVVHRPFLSLRRQRPAPFPSLTICTNAARSSLRILDVQFRRATAENGVKLPLLGMILIPSLILLLNIWGAKRSGSSANVEKDLALVHQAIHMLVALEPMWGAAGPSGLRESLCELLRAGGLPLPEPSDSPYQSAVPPLSESPPTLNRFGTGSHSSADVLTPNAQNGGCYSNFRPSEPTVTQTFDSNSFSTYALNRNASSGGTIQPQSTMYTAPPIATNQTAWDPSPLSQVGPSVSGQQPTSSVMTDDFLRTLSEMSARYPSCASVQPSYTPYGWTAGNEEPTWAASGPPNFEWEDFGMYFASGGVPPYSEGQ